jgi:hypothetical protein
MHFNTQADSPVRPISVGDALKISLDNYYDLLKTHVGGLAANEFLQLKLVADILDVSLDWPPAAPVGAHFYPWFSYFNMLERADRSIVPAPVSAGVETGVEKLSSIYGQFLQKLRGYVVKTTLPDAERAKIADYDKSIESLQDQNLAYVLKDRANWVTYANAMGLSVTDNSAYVQWAGANGHLQTIQSNVNQIQSIQFDIHTILDHEYKNADDRVVVEAEANFTNPAMRLRYPLYPDYKYDAGRTFTVGYLGMLPIGSTAQFDDRLAMSFAPALDEIKAGGAGGFGTKWTRQTDESSSINTDWGTDSVGGWGVLGARVSASDAKQINEDFSKTTEIDLSAKAAFKINIIYPSWFDPTLFEHRHVKENIHDFDAFFASGGSLLYYPISLVAVRGFAVNFTSSQSWTYDYKNQFSSSGSGGLTCLGYSFGPSVHYNSDVHDHKIDQTGTSLTFLDDDATVRFVGYAVKKVTVGQTAASAAVEKALAALL